MIRRFDIQFTTNESFFAKLPRKIGVYMARYIESMNTPRQAKVPRNLKELSFFGNLSEPIELKRSQRTNDLKLRKTNVSDLLTQV